MPEMGEHIYPAEQVRSRPVLDFELFSPKAVELAAKKPRGVRRLAKIAEFLVKKRRFRAAYAVARHSLTVDPEAADAHYICALAAFELRNSVVAGRFLEKARELDCRRHGFHHLCGRLYRAQHKFTDSVRFFDKALSAEPENPELVSGKAMSLFLSGDQEKALSFLDKTAARITAPEHETNIEGLEKTREIIRSFFKPEDLKEPLFGSGDGGNGSYRLASRPLTADYPFSIQDVELTNHCPMRCIMCPRTNDMTRPLGNMSFKTFKALFDQWYACDPTFGGGSVIWMHHYGESLVHPNFDKFIAYARALNAPVGLSINPLILTDPIAERLLECRPHTLWIALDGHDDESFEKIRGIPNAYDKSKRNALKFIRKKAERALDIHLEVIMINFPQNRDSIDEATAFWRQVEGIDKFQPKPFTTWDGSSAGINALAPGPEKMKPRRACNFPWSRMSVLWTGDVVACCYDYDGKYVLGNIDHQSLEEIWNGPRMKHLRASIISKNVVNKMCLNCENLVSY